DRAAVGGVPEPNQSGGLSPGGQSPAVGREGHRPPRLKPAQDAQLAPGRSGPEPDRTVEARGGQGAVVGREGQHGNRGPEAGERAPPPPRGNVPDLDNLIVAANKPPGTTEPRGEPGTIV